MSVFLHPDICLARLLNHASIFTADMQAISLALQQFLRKTIIFPDPLSSLQALINMKFDNPLIIDILELYTCSRLVDRDKDIILAWIPNHGGISGNTKVDNAAKEASQGPIIVHQVPGSDYSLSRRYIFNFWQGECVPPTINSSP